MSILAPEQDLECFDIPIDLNHLDAVTRVGDGTRSR
jgi:hypothetical protein